MLRTLTILGLLAGIVCTAGAAQYDLGAAEEALRTGKMRRAVELLRAPAEQGVAEAQFLLGMLYAAGGTGVRMDPAQAKTWYQKAATAGHVRAKLRLGEMLVREGQRTESPERVAEGCGWLSAAHAEGEADALVRIRSFGCAETGVAQRQDSAARPLQ